MLSRRTALAASGLALVGLAGCLGDGEDDELEESDADDDADENGAEDDEDAISATDPDAPLVTTIDREDAADDDVDAEEIVLATYGDVADLGDVDHDETQGWYYVSVDFTDDATASFVDDLEVIDALENPERQELTIHGDDEILGSYALGPDLAETMADGEWEGTFQLVADEESQLEAVLDRFEESASLVSVAESSRRRVGNDLSY